MSGPDMAWTLPNAVPSRDRSIARGATRARIHRPGGLPRAAILWIGTPPVSVDEQE